MLPESVDKPPEDRAWIYEILWGGNRLICGKHKGKIEIYNRSGQIKANGLRKLASELDLLSRHDFVVDGNFIPMGKDAPMPCCFLVYDVLQFRGEDLRSYSLYERKTLLRHWLFEMRHSIFHIFLSEYCNQPDNLIRYAIESGMAGIIAKRIDSPYQAGKSDLWLKHSTGSALPVNFGFLALLQKAELLSRGYRP